MRACPYSGGLARTAAGMAAALLMVAALAAHPQIAAAHSGERYGLSFPLVAEGFGARSIGGSGGEVIRVTTLDDSGPGSLREALSAEGPRIVRFEVGGIINLQSHLVVTSGRLTIDGYSAAEHGGITLHGHGLWLQGLECRDVIIQHIRIRRAAGDDGDCISIMEGAHRVIVDRCSLSWADDEIMGITMGHWVTVQWSILSEGMVEGEHSKGSHSMGPMCAHGANHVTLHHNYLTGNNARNPLLYGVGGIGGYDAEGKIIGYGANQAQYMPMALFDVRNNLIYNYGHGASLGQGVYANLIGNYYRHGPDTHEDAAAIYIESRTYYPGSAMPIVYIEDNLAPRRTDDAQDDWDLVRTEDGWGDNPRFRTDTPFVVPHVATHRAADVPAVVLGAVGALPRDEVDERLIEEYERGTGKIGHGYAEYIEKHGLKPSTTWE